MALNIINSSIFTLQKQDKNSINDEKSERIKQLTPEHQKIVQERAKARNSL